MLKGSSALPWAALYLRTKELNSGMLAVQDSSYCAFQPPLFPGFPSFFLLRGELLKADRTVEREWKESSGPLSPKEGHSAILTSDDSPHFREIDVYDSPQASVDNSLYLREAGVAFSTSEASVDHLLHLRGQCGWLSAWVRPEHTSCSRCLRSGRYSPERRPVVEGGPRPWPHSSRQAGWGQ